MDKISEKKIEKVRDQALKRALNMPPKPHKPKPKKTKSKKKGHAN